MIIVGREAVAQTDIAPTVDVINAAGRTAPIPSKEVLIAKFLGSIKSPIYSFAYAIQAVVDKGETAPAEAPAVEEAPAAEAAAEAPAEA